MVKEKLRKLWNGDSAVLISLSEAVFGKTMYFVVTDINWNNEALIAALLPGQASQLGVYTAIETRFKNVQDVSTALHELIDLSDSAWGLLHRIVMDESEFTNRPNHFMIKALVDRDLIIELGQKTFKATPLGVAASMSLRSAQ